MAIHCYYNLKLTWRFLQARTSIKQMKYAVYTVELQQFKGVNISLFKAEYEH